MPFRSLHIVFTCLIALAISIPVCAQQSETGSKVKKISDKMERAFEKDASDTLASAYYEMGEIFYQQGEVAKSESYFQKAKNLYESQKDAEGIARSSRALAKAQEDLHKNKDAIQNYITARNNSIRNTSGEVLNTNDVNRLISNDLPVSQVKLLQQNLQQGYLTKDTNEIVSNLSKMGDINTQFNSTKAINAYSHAFQLTKRIPNQAQYFNQQVTNVYLKDSNFKKAIETKKELLKEDFVQKSSAIKAREIESLADIYLLQHQDTTAIRLLRESYALSLKNGHTLQARNCIEKLDSIYRVSGRQQLSIPLYKEFLKALPAVIQKDSSLVDMRIFASTEARIHELESEKNLKDDLLRRKNNFNYWLIGSIVLLVGFITAILFMLKKLRANNKKIALQSLRREMNPHFIFNSLNSINQFIATNNELAANQYLSKFSTLMRGVMENSTDDFIPLTKEIALLRNYLELEHSRFPDKFDYEIQVSDALLAEEELYIPGMLVQPYLENAIWHGLRYIDGKGMLTLRFEKADDGISIHIEDNGIGLEASRKVKTANQRQHKGRGITNTQERIQILNDLYRQHIRCDVEDKAAPAHGVIVRMVVPHQKK